MIEDGPGGIFILQRYNTSDPINVEYYNDDNNNNRYDDPVSSMLTMHASLYY